MFIGISNTNVRILWHHIKCDIHPLYVLYYLYYSKLDCLQYTKLQQGIFLSSECCSFIPVVPNLVVPGEILRIISKVQFLKS